MTEREGPVEPRPTVIAQTGARGEHIFSAEQSRHELKAAAEAHRHWVERTKLEHDLAEGAKQAPSGVGWSLASHASSL